MQKKLTDQDRLRAEIDRLVEALELPELNKQFLRARWLEQVFWMEGKARGAVRWYYTLRLTTIVGGVIVPALVSLNLSGGAMPVIHTVTFLVSLLVALSAAVEEFFHYGERWRHYRRTAELLKSEGWQFFQLSGVYAGQTYAQAYAAFAARVEELSHAEVEVYMTQVVRDKKEKDDKTTSPPVP
jgi:hypothetical protein